MYPILTLIHTALAAFFLPMGLMYAVTGGLYSLGITGSYETREYRLELDHSLPSELSGLVALAEEELDARGLALPSGNARIRSGGTSYYFEWTGSRRDVELHPTSQPTQAVLKIKDTTPHRFFVQLHKAKGSDAFKLFAVAWMVGLVSLFLTGGVMAFFAKRYRPVAAVAGTLGLLSCGVVAWFS
jgi:hypothetical protein